MLNEDCVLFNQVVDARVAEVAGEYPTPREREVLYCRIVLGMSYKAIASELVPVLSHRTVRVHTINAAQRLRYARNLPQMRTDLLRAFARAEGVRCMEQGA